MNSVLRIFFAVIVGFFAAKITAAGPVRDQFVEAELVADVAAIAPGKPFTAALRLSHDPHWHTYWINPGDAGLPTSIQWTLPEGFSAGPIEWPAPSVTDTQGLKTYGYEGEIFLLVKITPPAALKLGEKIVLRANARWLMCKETCVPGRAALELALPVAADAAPSAFAEKIRTATAALPQPISEFSAAAFLDGKTLSLVLSSANAAAIRSAYFFSADSVVAPGEEQTLRAAGKNFVLTLSVSPDTPPTERLKGLLQYNGEVVSLDTAITRGPLPETLLVADTPTKAPVGLLAVLFGGFIGGLILNLMPCVFPVIGIKIMGFVSQAGEARKKIKMHGVAFTVGVLCSFWALSALLLLLRASGSQFGWGFQLQSPVFVFILAAVMLVFGLSMSGVFEIGGSLIGTGQGLQSRSGLSGSFFSGVLATVVATPCSAPFLAPALGAALAMPVGESLAVFTAIALGLSTPYLLLSMFPDFARVLPRPGAWMETFKQFMAFPLYATTGYLIWVLAGQTADSDNALRSALLGLVVIALAAWIYGRWAAISKPAATRRLATVIALLLCAGAVYLGAPKRTEKTASASHIDWQPWSAETVEKLRSEGRTIYVDFTARWCVTCQTNKAAVFSSSKVQRVFQEKKIATLRADWTSEDPKITAELARFGRSAVPFNLIYLPGKSAPVQLPEVLTPSTVLDALDAHQ